MGIGRERLLSADGSNVGDECGTVTALP